MIVSLPRINNKGNRANGGERGRTQKTEQEEETGGECTQNSRKMAEKLAPEKRHIFVHNGTFYHFPP